MSASGKRITDIEPSLNGTWTSRRLSPALGAEIIGLDLSTELTDEAFCALRQAWNDANGLLVVRNQQISVDQPDANHLNS